MIRGRVIYSDTGHPLRRADVFIVSQERDNQGEKSVTDRNGEFAFYGVSAGRYLLVADAPDIVNHRQDLSVAAVALKIALGQIDDGFSEVTVDGRSSVKTEIRVSRGGVITGRVMTETDEPIARALIKLFHVDENGRLRPAGTTEHLNSENQWMFETDSRGIYRIAGLPSGEYIVRASESDEGGNPDEAEEGSYTNGSMMIAFHPKALKAQDATTVKVVQGSETRDVDIRFTECVAHRIAGTVTLKGRPVAYAEIRLSRDDSDLEGSPVWFSDRRSNDAGRWEIRSVPDGNYTLWGYGSVGMTDGGHVMVAPLQHKLIVEGGDVTDLKLDLVPGAAVEGIVSVEGGASLPPGIYVELISAGPSAGKPGSEAVVPEKNLTSESVVAGRSYIEPAGKFTVSGLDSGSFYFRLTNIGNKHYLKSITLNSKDVFREPIKVEQGKLLEGIRLVLSADLVSLSGRAVETKEKSKPLRDAIVLLFPVDVERRRVIEAPIVVRTDKEGRFIVKGAPGDYFVFVFNGDRKETPVTLPTEASIVKNSSALQKITLQAADEKKVVEVTGPSQP